MTDPSDMRNRLIDALAFTSDDSIRIIYNIILQHIENMTDTYSKVLNTTILLDPVALCCLENYFKSGKWCLAEHILIYIFIMPTVDNFNSSDFNVHCTGTSGDTWRVRDNIGNEMYGLISMLVEACEQQSDITLDIPIDVFEYIKTWLGQHCPAIKSAR